VTEVAALSDLQTAAVLFSLMIAPLAAAGLALINAGLGRSRNAAHAMMTSLTAIAVAASAYFVLGHSFHGAAGEPARVAIIGRQTWDWLGAMPPFFIGLPAAGSPAFLIALMGIESVALAALIPLGSGAERWRLSSICASTAVLAGITFPVFAHWSWAGGWLAKLGFVDTGGAGAVHALGGLSGLAVVWLLGPRRGKYSSDGMPMAMPGHGMVFVLFGCMLAGTGWIGLNAAGAILFAGVPLGQLALVGVNTLLGAAVAALVAAVVTRARFGRPDASLTANGWVGGLVAVSAGCPFLPPAAAVLTGLVAGGLVTFSVELLELRLEVDDPAGSISVHAVAGIWGVLAAGMLGRFQAGTNVMFAQVVGVATLLGFVLPAAWGLNALLGRFWPMRVSPDGERQGMDLFELGAGAYPDFVTHTDDFMPR
jgi:ammonium transporter, Amt family